MNIDNFNFNYFYNIFQLYFEYNFIIFFKIQYF